MNRREFLQAALMLPVAAYLPSARAFPAGSRVDLTPNEVVTGVIDPQGFMFANVKMTFGTPAASDELLNLYLLFGNQNSLVEGVYAGSMPRSGEQRLQLNIPYDEPFRLAVSSPGAGFPADLRAWVQPSTLKLLDEHKLIHHLGRCYETKPVELTT